MDEIHQSSFNRNEHTASRIDINDVSAEQEFELLGATQDVDRQKKSKSNLDLIIEESGSKTNTFEGSYRQKERDGDDLQIIEQGEDQQEHISLSEGED